MISTVPTVSASRLEGSLSSAPGDNPAVRPELPPRLWGLLPGQLQRELNLPGSRIGQGKDPGGRSRRSSRVHDDSIVVRRREIGPIEDIEHLGPELRLERLRNLRERNILEQGKIHINQSRPNQRVPPGSSKPIAGVGGGEALQFDVTVGVLGIDGVGASWSVDLVGILKRVRIVFPERVPVDQHRKWGARLNRQDTPGFPVSENCLSRTCERRWRGNVPYAIRREVVPLVLVRKTPPATLTEPKQCGD